MLNGSLQQPQQLRALQQLARFVDAQLHRKQVPHTTVEIERSLNIYDQIVAKLKK